MKWAEAFGLFADILQGRSVARLAGFENYGALTWGSRPRLYACTCSAGFVQSLPV
jgi:hypothetical protein